MLDPRFILVQSCSGKPRGHRDRAGSARGQADSIRHPRGRRLPGPTRTRLDGSLQRRAEAGHRLPRQQKQGGANEPGLGAILTSSHLLDQVCVMGTKPRLPTMPLAKAGGKGRARGRSLDQKEDEEESFHRRSTSPAPSKTGRCSPDAVTVPGPPGLCGSYREPWRRCARSAGAGHRMLSSSGGVHQARSMSRLLATLHCPCVEKTNPEEAGI